MTSSSAGPFIQIGTRVIGPGHPCYVIAEVGVNHNGDPELAEKLVDVAIEAGADAVKFQSFVAERLVTRSAPKAEYQRQTTGEGESQLEMLRQLQLSEEVHRRVQAYCEERGILFFSTPFDEGSADLLDELGVPAFKVSSGDITNLPLLEHIARKGKPMLVSTGMSYLGEVEEAVRTIRGTGNDQLVLLHCVSNYPAAIADANLRVMHTMAEAFRVPVGYSDHTPGVEAALAAVALGACVVEKHFTLDKGMPGPDHLASLEPRELKALVTGIRAVEQALGDGVKRPAESEANSRAVGRRSLTAAADMPAGTRITREMLAVRRPGSGIPPRDLGMVVGRTTALPLQEGEVLSWESLL